MITLGGLMTRTGDVARTTLALNVVGTDSVVVADVTNDSRKVRSGSMFCCIRGEHHDGHDFAIDAVKQGASALLVDHELKNVDVPQVVASDTREAMGHLAAAFHDHPSRALTVIGVTGTNGKTTTAHMLGAILEKSGKRTKVLGTLSGARTTPEAPELQRTLADERASGTQAVVMEVSSHALALKRVAGMRFAAAVFTNLGHDHLDFHRTHEAYFMAKASLFSTEYAERAIINRDDAYGRKIADNCGVPVATYGHGDATDTHVSAAGSEFTWRANRIRCTVGGEFNVMNALAAATTAVELGVHISDVASGLAQLPRIPGRFENVNADGEFAVIVDYAHTPEALGNVIAAARSVRNMTAHPHSQVIVVFGCGGDRDPSKRADMGAASCAADHVIVTSDNPRHEDPQAIIDAIVAGVPNADRGKVSIEVDRRRAIEAACKAARSGDVVVIAGRGHETMQAIRGTDVAFSDAEVARTVLRGNR